MLIEPQPKALLYLTDNMDEYRETIRSMVAAAQDMRGMTLSHEQVTVLLCAVQVLSEGAQNQRKLANRSPLPIN